MFMSALDALGPRPEHATTRLAGEACPRVPSALLFFELRTPTAHTPPPASLAGRAVDKGPCAVCLRFADVAPWARGLVFKNCSKDRSLELAGAPERLAFCVVY